MKKILFIALILISVQSLGQTKLYAIKFNVNGTLDSFYVHEFVGNGVYNSTGNYIMPRIDSMDKIYGYEFPQAAGRFWIHADKIYRNTPPIAEAVDWSDVNSKPSTFTPATHSHPISEVTSLQTSLDGKQSTLGFTPLNPANNLSEVTASTARSNLGLGNVTNESKATMFTSPAFTGTPTGITSSHVGLGNVDNTSDANKPVSTAQQTALNNKSTIYFGLDAGANDSYVITASPVPSAYTQGMVVMFRANTANTTGCSINVNSLGVKTIVKRVSTTPATGDILAQMFCWLVYDGTNFVILNPVVN